MAKLPWPWTLALLKPDAVANPIVLKWIYQAIIESGLTIEKGCYLERLSFETAAQLYVTHKGKFYYGRLVRHVCSGPIIVMQLSLQNIESMKIDESECLKRWRRILGPSKFSKNVYLAKGEIENMPLENLRQYFSVSDTRNVGHGSDSLEELEREFRLFSRDLKEIKKPESELFQLHRFKIEDDDDGDESFGSEVIDDVQKNEKILSVQ